MDWAAGLASGIAAGAGEVQDQQKQADQDQQWLARQEQLMKMEATNQQARERYMLALKPPEKQEIKTTDDQGNHIVKTQRFQAPSDADIKAGTAGTWQDVGQTPDINFDKLTETQKHNQDMADASQKRIDLQSQLGEARIGIAQERLATQQAKGGGKTFSFEDYNNASPDQRALYDRYRRGEDDPSQKADFTARVATQKELAGTDATPADKANALYENQTMLGAKPFASVQAGDTTTAKPMGQFSGPQAKAQPNGKAPFSEGQTIYGPDGKKYIVRNGQPVPAP